MRYFLVSSLLILVSIAHSHPLDSDSAQTIGADAVFVSKELNLPANTVFRPNGEKIVHSFCSFVYPIYHRDRVIEGNLTVTKVSAKYVDASPNAKQILQPYLTRACKAANSQLTVVEFDHQGIVFICGQVDKGICTTQSNIGYVRAVLSTLDIELKFPTPVKYR